MAVSYTTNAKHTNYARICRALIDLGTDALRDVLNGEVLPFHIKNEIRKNPDSFHLFKDQKQCINNAAAKGSYQDFDITLLCRALRLISVQKLRATFLAFKNLQTAIKNCPSLTSDPYIKLTPQELCEIQAAEIGKSFDKCKDDLLWKLYTYLCQNHCQNFIHPSGNWGCEKLPDQSCTSLGDDIERIRLLRNMVYGHVSSTEMSDNEFNKYWEILENVMARMDHRFACRQYRSLLDNIKVDCMDPVLEQKYCEEIRKMAEAEKEMKKEMQNMKDKIEGLETNVDESTRKIEGLESNVNESTRKIEGLELNVNESTRKIEGLETNVNESKRKIEGLETNVNESTRKIEGLETNVDESTRKIEGLETNVNESTRKIEGLETNVNESTRKIEGLETSVDESTRKIEGLETNVNESTRKIEGLETNVNESTRKIEGLETNVNESTRKIEGLETNVDESTRKIEGLETNVNESTRKIEGLETNVNESTRKIEGLETNVDESTRKIEGLETNVNESTRKIEGLETNVNESTRKIEELETNVNESTRKIEGLETSVDESTRKIEGLETNVNESTRKIEGLETSVDESTRKIEGLESKVDETKNEVDAIRENLQAVNDAVTCMTEKEQLNVELKGTYIKNMLLQIDKHRNDKTFVCTDAICKGKDILKEHGILIFSGLPGHGKTKNAIEIMKQLQDENTESMFIELEDARKWNSVIYSDDNLVVLLNDVIGRTNIDMGLINEGDSHWRNIEAAVERRKAKFIITVRKNLLDRIILNLERYKLFDRKHTIDLTADQYKLNEAIKTEIINRHCSVNGIKICPYGENYDKVDINDKHVVIKLDNYTISRIVRTDPLIGFPLTVYLFCCKRKYTRLGASFFTKPRECLIEEINHLVSSKSTYIEKVQYCIMAYMALKNGTYENKSLDSEFFNRIIKSVKLPDTPTKRERSEAIDELLDRYIVKGLDDRYKFKHQTILESITVCFYQDDPELLLELCSKEFIEEFVRPENFKKTEGEVVCRVDREKYKNIVDRFLYCLEQGQNEKKGGFYDYYEWLIKLPLMEDEFFVDVFFNRAQSTEHMKKALVLNDVGNIFKFACYHGKTFFLDKLYRLCILENINLEYIKFRNLLMFNTLVQNNVDNVIWLLDHNFFTEDDLCCSLGMPNQSLLIKHSSVTLQHILNNLDILCSRSDSKIVKAILSRWPDLKQEHVLKMLETCIFNGISIECIDAIITCRPDIVTDEHMESVFIFACVGLFNSTEIMDYLLSKINDRKKMLDVKNDENLTYLHIAAFFGRFDVCMKLIELGFQLDVRTKSGLSVLQMVILGFCSLDTGKYVSSRRYPYQESNVIFCPEVKNILQDKSDILSKFCSLTYKKLDSNLTRSGCRILAVTTYTQLFEYIQGNNVVIRDTDFDLTIDAFGSKMVHYSVLYGDMAIFEMLHNINRTLVYAKTSDDLSCLHIAAMFGKLDIFLKLVEFGLCVSDRTCESDLSALQLAMIGFTFQDTMQYSAFKTDFQLYSSSLAYYFSTIGIVFEFGNKASYEQIINLLVDHKDFVESDLNMPVDIYGNSLTHYCVVYDSLQIIQLLGRKYPRSLSGENVIPDKRFPHRSDERFKTPIELSILMGRNEIFSYLLSHVKYKDINKFTELLSEGRRYVGRKLQFYETPDFLYFILYGFEQIVFGSDEDYTAISEAIQNHDNTNI